jgi:hypothetical protein
MKWISFSLHIWKDNRKAQLACASLFFVFTILALALDSIFFKYNYFDGRLLTTVLSGLYFLVFFLVASSNLRKLMFVMVFLSYIGELIFCNLFQMYHYRTNVIPLYVPLGHAIVYASGYVFAHSSWVVKNDAVLRKMFFSFFALLFFCVFWFLNDVFSLIFGSLFFLLLKRKKWLNLYSCIAFCVIFIELTGTFFQCWTWVPKIFGSIPTVNPPMGAVFFYAGGDVLLVKIVSYWKKNKKHIKENELHLT